jgi:hypothetical protein
MKTRTYRRITAAQAVRDLAGIETLDPTGRATSQSVARACREGQCGEILTEDGSRAVMVTQQAGRALWVYALAGDGKGGTIEAAYNTAAVMAQAAGLDVIATQTARPGLVRKLKACGFEVSGFVLTKKANHD